MADVENKEQVDAVAQPAEPEAAANAPQAQVLRVTVEPPGWAERYASVPNRPLHRIVTRFYAIIRRFAQWDEEIDDFVIDMAVECAVMQNPMLPVKDNPALQAKIQQIYLFAKHLLDNGILASELYLITDHAMMASPMPELDLSDRVRKN